MQFEFSFTNPIVIIFLLLLCIIGLGIGWSIVAEIKVGTDRVGTPASKTLGLFDRFSHARAVSAGHAGNFSFAVEFEVESEEVRRTLRKTFLAAIVTLLCRYEALRLRVCMDMKEDAQNPASRFGNAFPATMETAEMVFGVSERTWREEQALQNSNDERAAVTLDGSVDVEKWTEKPLWRVVLCPGSDESSIGVIVAMNHVLADGTTGRFLVRELLRAMSGEEFEAGEVPLAPAVEDVVDMRPTVGILAGLLIADKLPWLVACTKAVTDFFSPPPPPLLGPPSDTDRYGLARRWPGNSYIMLDADSTELLKRVARRVGVSTNSLLCSAAAIAAMTAERSQDPERIEAAGEKHDVIVQCPISLARRAKHPPQLGGFRSHVGIGTTHLTLPTRIRAKDTPVLTLYHSRSIHESYHGPEGEERILEGANTVGTLAYVSGSYYDWVRKNFSEGGPYNGRSVTVNTSSLGYTELPARSIPGLKLRGIWFAQHSILCGGALYSLDVMDVPIHSSPPPSPEPTLTQSIPAQKDELDPENHVFTVQSLLPYDRSRHEGDKPLLQKFIHLCAVHPIVSPSSFHVFRTTFGTILRDLVHLEWKSDA